MISVHPRKMALWLMAVALAPSQLQGASLEDMLADFLKNSPLIAEQEYLEQEAKARSQEQLSYLLPRVDARASISQEADEQWFRKETISESYGLSFRQTLWSSENNFFHWQSSTSREQADLASVAVNIQNLKLRFIGVYIDVLSQGEQLKHQTEQVKVLKKQVALVKARFEFGSAIASDLKQAEARLAASKGQEALSKSSYQRSLSLLQELTGHDKQGTLSWPEIPPTLPTESSVLYNLAMEHNPAIKKAKSEIEEQKSLKKASQSQYLPELAAEYNISKSRTPEDGSVPRSDEVLIVLNLNLFNGLRTYHSNSRLHSAISRYEERFTSLKRQLMSESEIVLAEYRAARSNLNSLEVAVNSAQEASRAFELEYASGTRDLSDLLDAEQELLQSQIGRIQAKAALLLSVFRIKWVSGSL